MPTQPSPNLIIISAGKGGVGKTTLTCAIADTLELHDRPFHLIQVDDQDRLPALYPGKVSTVAIEVVNNSRHDPNAIIRAFDPLYAAIEAISNSDQLLIVDVGATQQHALLKYAALTDLDEDLVDLGIQSLWIAPCTADPEAMQQCTKTLASAHKILPSLQRMVALNERDSNFTFYPGSPADQVWQSDLNPLCTLVGSLTIPRIEAGSWQPFEAAGLRFIDVIGASIQQIQSWTGVSRPEAKVIRGDVAAWMADLVDTLAGPLALEQTEADHEQ